METNELEFGEMKKQLRILQERLDKQVEINEKQLRRAIGENLGSILSRDKRGLILCILVALLVPFSIWAQGYSLVFTGFSFIFLAFNACMAYVLKFSAIRCCGDLDLVSTSKQLLKYKHDQRIYKIYMMPVVLGWLGWYIYEIGVELNLVTVADYLPIVTILIVSGVIGGIIGYYSFTRPAMRDADKVLSQIKELQGE